MVPTYSFDASYLDSLLGLFYLRLVTIPVEITDESFFIPLVLQTGLVLSPRLGDISCVARSYVGDSMYLGWCIGGHEDLPAHRL